jgi:hypothetical protein
MVTWEAATARRMERHGLATPVARERLARQAGAVCGIHAQVMGAGELSLALRVEGATRADVRAALWEQHTLVKTYGPRGTVHLLPADELASWTAALGAIPMQTQAWPEHVRFDEVRMAETVAAIGDVLAEAELTLDELTAALVQRCGPWAGERTMEAFTDSWPRWRQAAIPAAHAGALCYGPPRGRAVTFTNPRRFVPGFDAALEAARQPARLGDGAVPPPGDGAPPPGTPPPPTALVTLVRRWLTAYGPATVDQFARWTFTQRPWAAALFDTLAAAGELEQVDFDGERAWVVAGDTAFPEAAPESVRLLPYYDAYGIGCHPRARLFPGEAAERALVRGQAGPLPLLLVDGVVAGVWRQRRTGRRLAVTVEPLSPLSAACTRALAEQVERIGAIDGTTTALTTQI